MAKQNTYAPINAVANYFLLRTNVPAGDVMTHLKLQKLCYFAQAFNLVNHDCGMFKDTFQAWSHGPVAPALWRRFKKFTWQAIGGEGFGSLSIKPLSDSDKEILDAVWVKLGHWTARELEYWTHQHDPWRNARGNTPLGAHSTAEITIAALKKFYCAEKFKKQFTI